MLHAFGKDWGLKTDVNFLIKKSGATGCRIGGAVAKMGRGRSRDSSQRCHCQRWNTAQNWIASSSWKVTGTPRCFGFFFLF